MFPVLWHAWRSWKNAKGVALLAICALALGIGSTTAIYTVVQGVLLKPLPYSSPDRWVELFSGHTSEPDLIGALSNPDLLDYQARTHSFDVFGWYEPSDFNLISSGGPLLVRGAEVTPSLVSNLGVSPMKGRWFHEAAGEGGNVHLAVISASLWKRLGSDPRVIGAAFTLSGRAYTVTGVMPPGFRFPAGEFSKWSSPGEIWVPLNPQGPDLKRDVNSLFCYARRKPGVSFQQAEEDVRRVAAQISKEHPESHEGYIVKVFPLLAIVVRDIRPTLLLLLGAAGALLLITCANVAGLLLARSVTRARETAIRVALGAARWQLGSQYLVEGLLLSVAAAVLGTLISISLVRAVIALAGDDIPRVDEITLNGTVLAVTLATAALASVLFSLAPLWQALRTRPNQVLTEGVRSSAGRRSRALSRGLVVAEMALAFTLLAIGALLFTQLGALGRVAPGFDPHHLFTFRLNAPEAKYADTAQLAPYQRELMKAISRIPGVSGVGLVNQVPLNGCCISTSLAAEGAPAQLKNHDRVSFMIVSPSYLRTMAIPLKAGRIFDERDAVGDPRVIINETTARRYWPGQNPLGRYALMGGASTNRFQVVGIVADVKNNSLAEATVAEIYFPTLQASLNQMNVVVRAATSPQALFPAIRRAVASVNAAQPIYEEQSVDDIVQRSLGTQQLQSFMVSFFAIAALLMAALGVYGLVAYSVRQRTVEIGTRMAVGATTPDLFRMVIGDGLKLAGFGIGIGAIAVFAVSLLLRAKLFHVRVDSPVPFLVSIFTVAALAALACFFPAWRATLLSPMVAIRNDPGSIWRNARRRLSSLADQVSELVAGSDQQTDMSESELLADIAEAGRNAESFAAALRIALTRLQARMDAESLALFVQKEPGQPYRCTTVVPDACGEWTLPDNALIVSRLRHFAAALPITPADLDSVERWAGENAPERLPEIAELRETGAAWVVRVAVKDEIRALLFVGRPNHQKNYSAAQRRLLRAVAAQLAMLIENGRLTDRIVDQERLRRELALASDVQKRLFPEKAPETAHIELTGLCIPARGVGGDYYDFLDLGARRIGIALADVAGKGIAAALIMSVVQASLRSLAETEGVSLTTLATRMNRLLHRSTRSNSYATFFYAEVDENTNRLRFVNAGHNPPYLLRNDASATIEELSAGGTIIGMFAQSTYEEGMVEINKGDVLIVFTDGVPEALNPQEEEFGEDRLKDILRKVSHLSVQEMAARILAELKQWIADAEQYDDLTFVLMKVN